MEETPDLGEPAGENPVSSWILVIEAVQAAHGRLGWKAIHVGDTREAIEKTLGRELSLEEWEAPVCGRFFARIDYEGTTMELQFESPETDAALESIFLPISPYRGDKADLVERLKSTLPDFAYAPSIHAPDLAEGDNPTPLYVLPHHPSCAVLLKPEEGIYLSISQCLE